MNIRTSTNNDLKKVRSFYKDAGYTPEPSESDVILFAQETDEICGAARLCSENGVMVLRGMRVAEQHQRKGIGHQLLNEIDRIIGDNECFCLPFDYLEDFYGSIGFRRIDPLEVPLHLKDRFSQYKKMYTNIIIMKRNSRFKTKEAN